ncbi:hypothetical protein BDW22DRAFT_1482514 [Trametopsis cervina]|nr:hypothetical protein BDW22DRAFT_1482514 [Trametopsis cervina]
MSAASASSSSLSSLSPQFNDDTPLPAVPARMQTFLAGSFVFSAGSTLFRRHKRADGTEELQLCVLHQTRKNLWVLPKGRKDCYEATETAAVRETYEETGYPCEIVPLRMATRATWPGGDGRDVSTVRDGVVEPAGVTVMNRGRKGIKVIMWYVTRVKDGAAKGENTQMPNESYESVFLEVGEAVERLTVHDHRDIAVQAIELASLESDSAVDWRAQSLAKGTSGDTSHAFAERSIALRDISFAFKIRAYSCPTSSSGYGDLVDTPDLGKIQRGAFVITSFASSAYCGTRMRLKGDASQHGE